MKSEKLPITFRKADQSDVSFIFSSWLKSYRKADAVRCLAHSIYYQNQHKVIEMLLRRSEVVVSVNPEDPVQIYGYIVHEVIDGIPVIHYTYVKEMFRRMGIAKELIKFAGINQETAVCYTHQTFSSERIRRNRNFIFHPYLVYHHILPKGEENV